MVKHLVGRSGRRNTCESLIKAAPEKRLSLFDSTCIVVGIIIGAGIYETAPFVAAGAGSAPGVIAIWFAGGLLALTGALCYAELATAYPREGGDYVYLSRAYGSLAGYIFGWSQMAIVRPGDIALMAFVFARYAQTLYAPFPGSRTLYAVSAVLLLTAVNMLGVKEGKWTQNTLTMIKSLGLLAIVAAGMMAPGESLHAQTEAFGSGGLKLALILVLFTFGGWNETAYVAAEIKHPRRNIVRTLLIGTLVVTAMYVLVNGAFLNALGYAGMVSSRAVAVDTVAAVLPQAAGRLISVLICISALGAVNGLIFTGARISYALGAEHRVFRGLGNWSGRFGTPLWALAAQGCLSLAIILVAGSFIDTIIYTAPVVWLFFLATGISLLVLRHREPGTMRPYRVTAYPATPLVFCASSAFMLYSSVSYSLAESPKALLLLAGIILAGIILYGMTGFRSAPLPRERKGDEQ